MWKTDPERGAQFSDRFEGQEVLFAEEHLDIAPLRSAILTRFGGQSVAVETVEHFVVTETPYRETHYKRVLKILESDASLAVRTPRRRTGTFPSGTLIEFLA